MTNLLYKFPEQPKNFFYFFTIKNFTSSAQKQTDVDKIFEKVNKYKEQLEQVKKELDLKKQLEEKNKISENEDNFINNMWIKRVKIQKENLDIETKFRNRLSESVNSLPEDKKIGEVMRDFLAKLEDITTKHQASLGKYQEKHKDSLCVDSLKDLTSIEEKRFKNIRQTYQKAEEDMDTNLRAQSKFPLGDKNKYEENRLKWKQEIIEDIRKSKKEKDEFKKELVSNLEKPSEIAQDLMDQPGLDSTGGDE